LLLASFVLQGSPVFVHLLIEALPEADLAISESSLSLILHVLNHLMELFVVRVDLGLDLLIRVGSQLVNEGVQVITIAESFRVSQVNSIAFEAVSDGLLGLLVLSPFSLLGKRVLTDLTNGIFQVGDHAAVLLLSENVHLLLVHFLLLQLQVFIVFLPVKFIVLFIESWPILCGNFQGCSKDENVIDYCCNLLRFFSVKFPYLRR
jgi:hypothetical protein